MILSNSNAQELYLTNRYGTGPRVAPFVMSDFLCFFSQFEFRICAHHHPSEGTGYEERNVTCPQLPALGSCTLKFMCNRLCFEFCAASHSVADVLYLYCPWRTATDIRRE